MPTNNQEWEEEFDNKFTCKNKKLPLDHTMLFEPTISDIKSFIRQEIAKAKIEERERITKIIEEMKTDRKERTVLILMAVLAAINDRVTKENFDAVSNLKKQ